ncbi:alpha/beta hydrolase family protein [Catalinimonas niigatensis]|uniref:alpha/beta hydrolase family protein n=1 Tax=Catalinimonas niigatensis TaxID=1397264 RepID=UPI002667161A|nr:lipase family protein [Catalinimonas niigatensis]WPP50646.1 lipase family protein [Catalinimonas niigatensis]
MKIALQRIYLLFFCTSLLLINVSCEENEPTALVNEDEYLVDYERIAMIEANQLKAVAQIFQPSFDISFIQYNAELYKVTFQSEYKGEEIISSGLVCIPAASQDIDFPVLLGFHPSIGSQKEAPTSFNGTIQSGIELFASLGYITLIPDYIGFGSSASVPHPYLVRSSVSENSVEMIRAVEEMLDELGQAYQKEISMIGYSQGGYNTLATLRHFESTQPLEEWEITAAAAGGSAYDLNRLREQIFQGETYGSPESIAYLIWSYHEYYDLPGGLEQYFQEEYADFIADAFGNDFTLGQVKGRLTRELDQLLQEDFLAGIRTNTYEGFSEALDENSIDPWQIQTPLHLYHATKDSVVSIDNSRNFFDEVTHTGSQELRFTEMTEATGHTGAGAPMLLDGILWLLSFQNL